MPISALKDWCRRAQRAPILAFCAVLWLLQLTLPATSASQPPAPSGVAPELQVEYVGSDKGYAVSGQSVTVLCVIRNSGSTPLPENTARVRCYPLTGLDFMEGQLWPVLPPLAPGQAVAYRWRLALSDPTTPLVFSVIISKTEPAQDGATPRGPRVTAVTGDAPIASQVAAAAIPRFASTPHLLGAATAATTPQATAGRAFARVGNDRSMVNVLAAQDHTPVLILAGKVGADWKVVATAFPIAQIDSAEEGQTPWWESFRWSDTDFHEEKGSAVLTLNGSIGSNWTAHLVLESRAETGVIYGKLRLIARRTVRAVAIRLPRLLAVPEGGSPPGRADGSAAIIAPNSTLPADSDRIAAAHSGALTFGITWPPSPPQTGWTSAKVASGDVEHLPILGAQWSDGGHAELISAGTIVELPFRIFVFGPSDTVKDAARFRIP